MRHQHAARQNRRESGGGMEFESSGASGGSLHRGASFKVEKAHFAA